MEIHTKYNIGQELWTLVSEKQRVKARKVTITSIQIEALGRWDEGFQKTETRVNYYFELDNLITNIEESQNLLFATKEELAQSIIES